MAAAVEAIRLQEVQLAEAGEVLSRAFLDDPMFLYVEPDDARRLAFMPWFMMTGARYGHLFGRGYTTAGKVEGNAVWLTPEEKPNIDPDQMASAGMSEAPARMGEAAFGRFMHVIEHFAELHERAAPAPHWYLMILGVDPPRQGQGIGSRLIQ